MESLASLYEVTIYIIFFFIMVFIGFFSDTQAQI
jgi:hypothetical protein